MTIGKSLGAGVPIAATLFSEPVAAAAAFGDHGSTYGGNLLACRAALVFLDELVAGGLMGHVARVGPHLETRLRQLQSRHPMIREIRGAGLMWGLDLDRPAAPIVEAAIQQGLLVNRTSDTVVRLLPPYIITAEEIDEATELLDAALIAAFGGQQK
jgi:acetylornithine/N-succinyldiaminopimelate aminotransferase